MCACSRRSRTGASASSPRLNATQSLWAVAFAAIALGGTEAIGSRLVVASVLIVAGGALIGVGR
jgi:hypothetical protein